MPTYQPEQGTTQGDNVVNKITFSTWHAFSWPTLRRLGTNKAIRSANIWAFIVPITAKLMEKVQDQVSLDVFGHTYLIQLELPFSWKVWFVAALAFMLANFIFNVWCPIIIKETESYRDFAEQKRSFGELEVVLRTLGLNKWDSWFLNRNSILTTPQPHASFGENYEPGKDPYSPENEERAIREIYSDAVNLVAKTKALMRSAASILYITGMIGLTILLSQNVLFVARHW